MKFKSYEKAATLRLLTLMPVADGAVDAREVGLLQILTRKLGATSSDIAAGREMSISKALSIAKGMSADKKKIVCALLSDLIIVDGNVDKEEIALWVDICEKCEFPYMNVVTAHKITLDFINK